MFKDSNRNTKKTGEMSSGVIIVNFEHILHLILMFLLLTLLNVSYCFGPMITQSILKSHTTCMDTL